MDYCINPFFSVVLVLWHNHLTSFVCFFLLTDGFCRLFAASMVRPVLAASECKITSFFSNSNGFMQKTTKRVLISYYLCTFVPGDEPLIKAGGSESGVLASLR